MHTSLRAHVFLPFIDTARVSTVVLFLFVRLPEDSAVDDENAPAPAE